MSENNKIDESNGTYKHAYDEFSALPVHITLHDIVKVVDALDNVVHAINNLAAITKEKGNKYGY